MSEGGTIDGIRMPRRPSTLLVAVWMMVMVAVIGVVSTATAVGMADGAYDQLLADYERRNPDGGGYNDLGAFAVGGVVILAMMTMGLLSAMLWMLMAWKNASGRPWAPKAASALTAVGLVLGGLKAAGVIGDTTATSLDRVDDIITIVQVAVAVVAAALLWTPSARAWFREAAARQPARPGPLGRADPRMIGHRPPQGDTR